MNGPRHGDYFGTTGNPCPWWCEHPAGHGYDNTDDQGHPARLHSYQVGGVTGRDLVEVPVLVETLESLVLDGDGLRVQRGPLLCSAPEAETLDQEMAHHLAYLLTQAAHFMDDISC